MTIEWYPHEDSDVEWRAEVGDLVLRVSVGEYADSPIVVDVTAEDENTGCDAVLVEVFVRKPADLPALKKTAETLARNWLKHQLHELGGASKP